MANEIQDRQKREACQQRCTQSSNHEFSSRSVSGVCAFSYGPAVEAKYPPFNPERAQLHIYLACSRRGGTRISILAFRTTAIYAFQVCCQAQLCNSWRAV